MHGAQWVELLWFLVCGIFALVLLWVGCRQ
jgi:hypothetical protein